MLIGIALETGSNPNNSPGFDKYFGLAKRATKRHFHAK